MPLFAAVLLALSALTAAEHPLFPRQTVTAPGLPDCVFPPSSVVATPTGRPQLPSDVAQTVYELATNCGFSTAAPSIHSTLSSFSAAYTNWVSANYNALESYISAIQSYQSSEAKYSSCAEYYSGMNPIGVITGSSYAPSDLIPTFLFACETAADTDSTGAMSVPTTTATVTSPGSTGKSSATILTTVVAVSSAKTQAASSSTSSAASPGIRAGTASAYFLYVGASVAAASFVAMLAL